MMNKQFTTLSEIDSDLQSERLLEEIETNNSLETIRIFTNNKNTNYIIREIIEPTNKYIPVVKYNSIDTYVNYQFPTGLTNHIQLSKEELQTTSNKFYNWVETQIKKYITGKETEINPNSISFNTQNRIFITPDTTCINKLTELTDIQNKTESDTDLLQSLLPNEILVEIDYRQESI